MATCTIGTTDNKIILALKYLPGNPEYQMKHTVETSEDLNKTKVKTETSSPDAIAHIQNALMHWNTVKYIALKELIKSKEHVIIQIH